MAGFGMELKDKEQAATISKIAQNLRSDDFIRNPFDGRVKKFGTNLYVVSITPRYPKFYLLFFLPLLVGLWAPYTWYGITAFVITGVMLFIGLWWWNVFYFFLFWIMTKGGVRWVGPQETLRRVV